ncbi:uncharacterized protein LOC115698517 isoform X3 [Cannabis sativa]|uniref:uncharacterized protein LOC115698517 isoform X3 n=1 Tax=Cannabis sativa TaxID=3483 RepID=UPI0029C9C3BA|nr:uncharacterized protein LOC115698517 isoform X3 [Cannabis sativa]
MSYTSTRFIRHFRLSSAFGCSTRDIGCLRITPAKKKFCTAAISVVQKGSEELLVVVGGGAAGFYGAVRAKTVAPKLNVVVIEKGQPLSKVKISGGGRCNVTNGHCVEKKILAENYPRGHKEFKGSFFDMHGPDDTMSWFSDHGVDLKVEEDGRVFPVSNSSSTIIDCLMSEANRTGVVLQTGKTVRTASANGGKFLLGIGKQTTSPVEYVEADYLLIASGNSSQVTFSKVKAKLILESVKRNIQQFTQVGPMLVTHWGLSGPVILRLSAWGARDLFSSCYKGTVTVDFIPDLHIEAVKSMLSRHKLQFLKQKVSNSYPPEFGLVKRFWKYILDRQGFSGDDLWSSIPNNTLASVASLLKNCDFRITGKGQFKDEFVKAGGVLLSEISLNTMESKIHSNLFLAGEVLNVDGVTGGFNFQNAWSGGYIAGSTIGTRVSDAHLKGLDLA